MSATRACKSRKHSKTFTGCWTCRARNVKCDETKPVCMQCAVKRFECAGYGVRLHWLPPEQGASRAHRDPPDLSRARSQRSQIPFEPRRRALSEDQLDQILNTINGLEPELNRNPSGIQDTVLIQNFGVFDACPSVCDSSASLETPSDQPFLSRPTFNTHSPPITTHIEPTSETNPADLILPFSPLTLEDFGSLLCPNEDEAAIHNAFNFAESSQSPEITIQTERPTFRDEQNDDPQQENDLRVNAGHYRWEDPTGAIICSPTPRYLSSLEQFLMHHYMHRVVRLFCVIDNMKSPWQKIHLTRALQSTGQMNVEGSASRIQDALRNALLSISAFTLSNDRRSRGCEDDVIRWANEAMVLRGKTIKLLKDSVEQGFGASSPPKYKDFLATMLSMISINVMSGDTNTCGVHLDGALHFMKMARSWKMNYSPKAQSLHRIYIYLRTIYESTAMRSHKDIPGSNTSSKLLIPELSPSGHLRITEGTPNTNTPSQIHSVDSSTRMSTYECIYGIPQNLLILLSRTTELIVAVTEAREVCGSTMIPDNLARQCDELENIIMDWSVDSELDAYFVDGMSASADIIRKTACAFHHALIIYFAQHIRLIGHRYLQSHIETVLYSIEAIERIKADSHCWAAPLYWPAFIAASEAFDERLRQRFRAWYEQVEVYGIAAVRTGTSILTRIWKDGPGTGNRITSRWRIEVKRTSSNLMLS